MIVKMKHLDLLCMAADKEATLKALRELGAVHLDLGAASGMEVSAAKGAAADAEKAVRLILKARETSEAVGKRPHSVAQILEFEAERLELKAETEALDKQIRIYEPYGDFDPALARKLLDAGIDIKSVAELPEKLPERRLSAMQRDRERAVNRMNILAAQMAGTDEKAILKDFPALADRIEFEAAREIMQTAGSIAAISGWLPAAAVDLLKAKAAANGWGTLVRDPAHGELPPTLIEPPKLFRPVKALFEGLGIAPAYNEADVSVPFLCYFSIFFAMLVGDGAYGAIFLAATLYGWWKTRRSRSPLAKSWLVMLTVFSVATVVWGVLSGTWFGANVLVKEVLNEASEPTLVPRFESLAALSAPAIWLADVTYKNMMLLCFTIGVSHLMLARIWNGVCRLPDSTSAAEFGWAGILLFMYLVTNSIVGIFPGIPVWGYVVFGVSLVAVFGFSVKPSELGVKGAELGMLPLNIMSALGDIISYVRLFAVGLASVKVAENFNSMATGLMSPENAIWLNCVMALAMALILVLGHALNLAMAGLSILVHAVRLNTLEFSNHKGVSWSGYAFKPFRKN